MELKAMSGLSAPIASLPQEVRDVSALEDLGKDLDPDAEVTANVGACTRLSDLAVGTTANVGATTSLTQTTPHTSRKSDVAADIGGGRADLVPGTATEILSTPSYLQSLNETSTSLLPGHDRHGNVVFLSDLHKINKRLCYSRGTA